MAKKKQTTEEIHVTKEVERIYVLPELGVSVSAKNAEEAVTKGKKAKKEN